MHFLDYIILANGITEPSMLVAGTSHVNVLCFCDADGSATIEDVYGGVEPYSVLWNTGSSEFSVSGLSAGNYIATITDAVGCTAFASCNISQLLQVIDPESPSDVSGFWERHPVPDFRNGVNFFSDARDPEPKSWNIIYPNPVNENFALVEFSIKNNSSVILDIYDITGQLVHNLYTGFVNADQNYCKEFNVGNMKNGIYFLKFSANEGC